MSPRQKLVRRASAILLVLWVGLLVASFVRRHLERNPSVEPVDLGADAERGDEQPVRVHRGFVYTDTVGAEPNFRVAAQETVQFASGWYELRDTEMWLYRDGEVIYGLTATGARFNPARREAHATGDVQLSLQGGVVLRSAGFSLRGAEGLLESHGAAWFAGSGFGGVAGGVRCSLNEDTVDFVGGVSTAWRDEPEESPSLVLLAPVVNYDRRGAVLTFPDGLTLLQGGVRMRGRRAELQLEGAESGLRRATLGGGVEISGELPGGVAVEALAGEVVIEVVGEAPAVLGTEVAIDSAAEAGSRFLLAFSPASDLGWVHLRWRTPEAGWRELNTWRLVGEMEDGVWSWLEGQGLACGVELRPREQPLHIEAERFRLSFAAGQPATARAEDKVKLWSGDQWAHGEKLSISLTSKTYDLQSGPNRWVTVGTPDLECQAAKLESGVSEGELVGRGGVSGKLRRGSLWGGSAAPVRFASSSMRVLSGGDKLVLEGDARLWQGDRLVRADYLEYRRGDEVVIARGNVVTVAPPGDGTSVTGAGEIRARFLEYHRAANMATYEGNVILKETRSTVHCQRLVINLSPEGKLLLATLEGGVTILEAASSRTIKGQTARLDSAQDLFDLWGSPVIVEEPGGNQIKGDHLQWRRAIGTVTVVGGEESPSETLYRPAPAPPGQAGRSP